MGQTTRNLLTRLYEHNAGVGCNFTEPPHRHWPLAAFIPDFTSDASKLSCEQFIHKHVHQHRPGSLNLMTKIMETNALRDTFRPPTLYLGKSAKKSKSFMADSSQNNFDYENKLGIEAMTRDTSGILSRRSVALISFVNSASINMD